MDEAKPEGESRPRRYTAACSIIGHRAVSDNFRRGEVRSGRRSSPAKMRPLRSYITPDRQSRPGLTQARGRKQRTTYFTSVRSSCTSASGERLLGYCCVRDVEQRSLSPAAGASRVLVLALPFIRMHEVAVVVNAKQPITPDSEITD